MRGGPQAVLIGALTAAMAGGALAGGTLPRGRNAAALAAADRAVAEMRLIARTPQERTLAQHDAAAVSRLKAMLAARTRRPRQSSGAMGDGGPIATAGGRDSQGQALAVTQPLPSLQLQSAMRTDNRQLTMVSSLMKTKHDTVKTSIATVR